MKPGVRWVLGDENSISIYRDKWLRGKPNFCVETGYNTAMTRDVKVSEFFLRNCKAWNEDKIRNTFSSVDSEAILAVRIPQSNIRDRVAWVHSNNGLYSVRSGYHFWLSNNTSNVDIQQSGGWGRLWKLCVPHKIKVLLWRLCRNNVLVRNRLRGKGIYIPISCVLCTGDIEHLLHLFFDCSFSKSCWQYVGLAYEMAHVESAPEWLLDKLNTESSENLVKIAAVIWGIWWTRNKMVWEGKRVSPEIAMSWSLRQISEWKTAQDRKNKFSTQLQQGKVQFTTKWQAPTPGNLKLNVDASVQEGADYFSVGLVCGIIKGHLYKEK